MRMLRALATAQNRLDVVAGFVDGILNALTLTSSLLLNPGHGATWTLAMRVGVASASTTAFVFFVAHVAQLRAQLIESEKQLNLTRRGRLAMTNLGRQVRREALAGAMVAAGCSLFGAGLPLMLSALLPGLPIVSVSLTVLLLGVLGVLLALSISGSPLIWASTLMSGGVVMTFVGVKLRLVG